MVVTKALGKRWMMVNGCLRPKQHVFKADFNQMNLLETRGGDDSSGKLLHVQKKNYEIFLSQNWQMGHAITM